MRAIDVDIGGTFTDCFVSWDARQVACKSATTPYDLSVGLLQAMEEAAGQLGLTVPDLLAQLEAFRYSTTVAMNRLIERKGPRLGLIVTAGFEDLAVIGKGSQWSDGLPTRERRNLGRIRKPVPLIPRHLTVGVRERIDSFGNVIRPLDEDDVRLQVQHLVDQGVRGFVISLLWSFINPVHERRVQAIIEEEYPDYFLGAMPIVASHAVHPKRDEYTRTVVTTIHTYLHQILADEIGAIRDELRARSYAGPLLMVHNTGGMAESARTAAVQTFNGGPVAGLIGIGHICQQYGYPNAVVADMGGTSFDIGIVCDGETRSYLEHPVIDRWLVDLPILDSRSIGAGGGSIARLNRDMGDRLEVGPESAGAMPGPACYDLGGSEPTVTDADVTLGLLAPDRFLGGAKRLNAERARQVIQRRLARPLGVTVEEAALLVRRVVDASMGHEIFKSTVLKGRDPRQFVLFAIGGAGPLHAAGFARQAGIAHIVVLPYAPVFSASASSTMDIVHLYEQSRRVPLLLPGSAAPATEYDTFNGVVAALQEQALRDLTGEGFTASEVEFHLELDLKYGGQVHVLRSPSPRLRLDAVEDVLAVYARFEAEYSRRLSALAVYPQGGVDIEAFLLRAQVRLPKPVLAPQEVGDPDPSPASRGRRPVYWEDGWLETPVYAQGGLRPGMRITGPGVIEASHTTVAVPPGWRFTVDRYANGLLERADGA